MATRWISLSDAEIDLIKARLATPASPDSAALYKKLSKAQVKIKPSSGKDKGRELQQYVCRQLSAETGIPYDQQDDHCLIHSREMGQMGVDVILRGDAQEIFPFAIECKSTEHFNLTDTIRQARANQGDKLDWLVVFRSKVVRDPVALLDFGTLLKIGTR